MIILPQNLRDEILHHAAAQYPEECCGILLGTTHPDTLTISRTLPVQNSAPANERHQRYLIDPRAILDADKLGRIDHLEIVGFYHSHPDYFAVPSATDLALAFPDYFYLICQITAQNEHTLRAWRLSPQTLNFEEVPLTLK